MKISLYQKCIDDKRLELLTEWDAAKNEPLAPWTVSPGSHSKVWWRCREGHEWQAPVYSRWAGHGCPVCGGQKLQQGVNDLASRRPELAAEWHPTKNGDLTPALVFPNSTKTVWWQCKEGHEWQATVNARANGSGCPVCSGRKLQGGCNDLATAAPELAREWHPTKNGDLTPDQVFPGSGKRVWWQCEEGHEWQASIASRAKGGNGCPVCAGRKTLPGVNDLATQFPDVAAEWHPTKNGALRPEYIQPYSAKTVWWRCEEGHEWQATVKSRVKEHAGCPICANRTIIPGVNDLATLAPALAAEWDTEKNGTLTPQALGPGSSKRVWWRCEKGHEWRAQVSARAGKGCGCPVCAGKTVIPGENDLKTFAPDIAAQWDAAKNGALTPEMVRPQSNRTVWWRCDNGHEWKAGINARVQTRSGCPYCTNRTVLAGYNDLATMDPAVADQWAWDLNGMLTPRMVTKGSRKKIWWRCELGHVWRAAIYSRTGAEHCGCPVCAGNIGQKRLQRMRRLEEETRAMQLDRLRLLPERYVPAAQPTATR